MRLRKLGGKHEKKRAKAAARLVPGLILGLAVGAPAAANVDCEPVVIEVKTFTPTSGALRNTSDDGAETVGSDKSRRIGVVVELGRGEEGPCPPSESWKVDVRLIPMNNVGGLAPFMLQPLVSKVLAGGESANFGFEVFYDRRSCLNGHGPVPRDQGGVDQVNIGAFTFWATASFDGNDPGPNEDTGMGMADLICKPSRTTL